MLRATVLLFVAILPSATASGTLEVGPAVVILDNGIEGSCERDVTGLCLVGMTGGSVGDMEVYAYERVAYIGVGVNRTYANEVVGYDLLPDGAVELIPSDHSVEHPLFEILIEVVGVREGIGPLVAFGFGEDEWGASYYGPGVLPPDAALRQHDPWIAYGDEGSEYGLLERDRIRPTQDFGGAATDAAVDDWHMALLRPTVCGEVGGPCAATFDAAIATYHEATPNVEFGAAFVEVDLGTDPSALSPSTSMLARESSASPLTRTQAAQPDVRLSRLETPQPTWFPLVGSPVGGGPFPHNPDPTAPPLVAQDAGMIATPPREDIPALLTASIAFAIAVLLAALYARVRPQDSLASGRREAILSTLRARGPLTVADLARSLGVDRTTIEYHARLLARGSVVGIRRHDRYVLLMLPGQPVPEAIGRVRAADQLLTALVNAGGSAERSDLGKLVPTMPARTLKHALKQLQEEGRVERVQGAGAAFVRLVGQTSS